VHNWRAAECRRFLCTIVFCYEDGLCTFWAIPQVWYLDLLVVPPFLTPSRGTTAELSSANHTCFTSSLAVSMLSHQGACINGCVEIAYIALSLLHCHLVSHPPVTICGPRYPNTGGRRVVAVVQVSVYGRTQSFDVFWADFSVKFVGCNALSALCIN